MEGVIGYTTLFAGNFAPRSWAFCQGQIINISSNTALFSILGTTYGGNGTTTFGLPDLRGRAVVGVGQSAGTSLYSLGELTGIENTTLVSNQLAAHVHPVTVSAARGSGSSSNTNNPNGQVYGADSGSGSELPYSAVANAVMAPFPTTITMQNTGLGQAFSNRNPYLALNYIICLQGVFPARN